MTKKLENFKDVLKIKSVYADLIPALTDEKFKGLKADIKKAGVIYDPIIVDEDNVILDGHHRYKIAKELDLSYRTEVYKVKDIDQKRLWLVRHQKNRRELTKDQWAVIGLDFLPYFTEVCRIKKSEGGKNKKSTGKSFVATDMARKEVDVNSVMMKNIKSINDHIPEFIPFIRNGIHSIRDGKHLQRECPEGFIVDDEGKLTNTAKNILKSHNNPVLTEAEIAANKAVKEAKKQTLLAKKEADDKKANQIAEDLEEENRLKEARKNGTSEDSSGGENTNLPIDKNEDTPKPKLSDDEKKAKIASLEITKFVKTLAKVTSKEVFANEAILHDGRKEPEAVSSKLFAALNMTKESPLPPNNVLVIPNTMLNTTWSQLITSASTFYIDSDQYTLRILYFGKEANMFFSKFVRFGVVSASIKKNLKRDKEPADKTPKAEIVVLTPPEKIEKAPKVKSVGK